MKDKILEKIKEESISVDTLSTIRNYYEKQNDDPVYAMNDAKLMPYKTKQ